MKRLVKKAPSANDYRSDYEPSIGLIEQIAKDTRESYNTTHPALSANDVLLKLLAGETVKVTNPFGTEVLWTLEEVATPAVPFIDKGYELLDTYRGFKIGARGRDRIGIYRNGESYSMTFFASVPQAQAYIDRLIKSGFIEWFERYAEARVERGLKTPPSRERAAAAFHAQRQPEDLVLDDLLDASRYSITKQFDGSWAVFNGGGFVKAFLERNDAVAYAKEQIEADIVCGVPVIREVA